DRIDRAGFDAQGAADARRFVDVCDFGSTSLAATRIERDGEASGAPRKDRDQRIPPWRAAVDRRARGHRLGIGQASVVAAAPALRLRQHGVDCLEEFARSVRIRLRAHPADSTLRVMSVLQPRAPAPVLEQPLARGFAAWLGAALLKAFGWKVVLAQPVPQD